MNTRVVDLCHRPFKRIHITSRALCATFALIGILVVAQPATAATLLINADGQLTGATGVIVEGTLYDVAFVDGSCVELFSGCDDLTDFTFTTQSSAIAASQALLDQVFLGSFDTSPALTLGCEHPTTCYVATPFSFVTVGAAINAVSSDIAATTGFDRNQDFRSNSVFVYADWTPAAASVPEPASMLLLGTGLAGMGVRRWRQRRA